MHPTPLDPRISPRRCLPAFALALLVSACSSGSGGGLSPNVAASAVIGPSGGVLSVSTGRLAGASITIPAGALSQDETVSIVEDRDFGTTGPTGFPVGFDFQFEDGMKIEPRGLRLAARATVVMPGGVVPDPTGGGDPAARRTKVVMSSPRRGLLDDALFTRNGDWQIDEFGSLAIAEYGGDLEMVASTFLPNDQPDSFSMGAFSLQFADPDLYISAGSDLLLALERMDPPLPISPSTLPPTGGTPTNRDVLFLGYPKGGGEIITRGFGTFWEGPAASVPPDEVFVSDVALEVLPQFSVVDGNDLLVSSVSTATHDLDVFVSARQPLETTLGIFPDVLSLTLRFTAPIAVEFELWLAPGIGPVQYRQTGPLGPVFQRVGSVEGGFVFGQELLPR